MDLTTNENKEILVNERALERSQVNEGDYSHNISIDHHTSIFKDFYNNEKLLYRRSQRITENENKLSYVFYSEFTSELDYSIHNPMAFAT